MTTLVAPQPTGDVDDVRAIAELHRLHAAQRIALVAVSVGGLALAKQSRPCTGTTCSTPVAPPSAGRSREPRPRTWSR